MTIIVQKNKDINLEDKINVERTYYLDSKNTFEQDLILIYLYFLPNFPTHGIKVGMTKCKINETFWHALETRIKNQHHELALDNEQLSKYGNIREVIYWGVCLDTNNETFKDYIIHKKIKEKYPGLIFTKQEWFINIPQKDIIDIFNEIRKNENKEIFTPRKEQQKCINDLENYFKENPIGGKFLLNCKMRFGKCYTTYKYCENNNINKILILTFVPAVQESWNEDLFHIEKKYKYYTDDNLKQNEFHLEEKTEPFIVFLSLQNYLGKDNQTNSVKNKIKKLQNIDWDLLIFDEYHFGALNNKTKETFEDLDKNYQNNLKKNKNIIDKFKIQTEKTICLSGTPFKSLARGEFTDKNSSTYSYFDEQKNKYPDPNNMEIVDKDYAKFPDMKIFAYDMKSMYPGLAKKLISNETFFDKKDYFSLNKFFETKKDYDQNFEYQFIYEKEIKNWLEIIKGKSIYGKNFPYSNPDINSKDTIWLMPTINSCIAMTKIIQEDEYFKRYQIINLSDKNVGSGKDALNYLNKKINESENTNKLGSISITVNKLTIGITIKKWSSIFILKDLFSPETYFQSIFRIQTPLVDENNKILKKIGYVYDFNIDRAASLLLKYAEESFNKFGYSKLETAKLIVKYLPIYRNGNIEKPIDVEILTQLAYFGDSSGKTLSQKIKDTEYTTWIQNEDIVAAMLNDNEIPNIIKLIFSHAKLTKSKKRDFPLKPEDDSFKDKITLDGRNKGYELGKKDYNFYLFLDDNQVQEEYDKNEKQHIENNVPNNLDELHKKYYINGFKKGYELGINAPIKKLQCGESDGIKFVEKIKDKFGSNISYTSKTKREIENFIINYLNNINNIPEKYKGKIYKRWYCDSFKKAVKKKLSPIIKNGDISKQDLDNSVQHIITRLFEFLYISVYRETTFDEIFKNANPDVFLEAVGITKEDFEKFNKYKILNEKIINNFIKEFFRNETIGTFLDFSNEKVKKKYRNSFNWFGYGITEKY